MAHAMRSWDALPDAALGEIAPAQISDYKIALHQRFIREWMAAGGDARGLRFEEIWRIREACIAALGQSPRR